ncbi:hypothetical protein AAMO2058_001350000 [Amorphochlora amoebiformis]
MAARAGSRPRAASGYPPLKRKRRTDHSDWKINNSGGGGGGGRVKAEEQNERRLATRQKQIDFGKNTLAYDNYTRLVPRRSRRISERLGAHPVTPKKTQICSKRSWDGQVRKWRRLLHGWDNITQVDNDLKPKPQPSQTNPTPIPTQIISSGLQIKADLKDTRESKGEKVTENSKKFPEGSGKSPEDFGKFPEGFGKFPEDSRRFREMSGLEFVESVVIGYESESEKAETYQHDESLMKAKEWVEKEFKLQNA